MLKNHHYFQWIYKRPRYRHIYNISTGIFNWLFLLITLPFGLYENNLGSTINLALFLFPIGILWTIISYAVDLVFGHWTLSVKQNMVLWIVKITIQVHMIYLIREMLCDWSCIDLLEYTQLWIACLILFALTYIPFSLYARYVYFHSLVGVDQGNQEKYRLTGEGKESIMLDLNTIMYIQSDDNYVDMFLAELKNPGKKIVFRCTLKSLEDQLKDYPQFVRIHRSIVINMRYVAADSADSRARKSVTLVHQDFVVALSISKSFVDAFEALITHPK